MPARAGLALILASTLTTAGGAQEAPAAGESFDVRHYTVVMDLDIAAGTIAQATQLDDFRAGWVYLTRKPAAALP